MTLLGPLDPPPVLVANPEGASPFLLVADHAGRRCPAALGDLGVAAADWDRHIAWDIGIEGFGALLARLLDATLIAQDYSRLVIDCNRAPGHPGSIPEASDGTAVPGNRALAAASRAAREAEILEPYHRAIAAALARRRAAGRPTVLVALHSFTPALAADGLARPWHAGVLHAGGAFPRAVLDLLRAEPGLVVGDNEPYRLSAEADHTVPRHAWTSGLDHVELEIRQDLLADVSGRGEWASRLARILGGALEHDRPGSGR